MSKILIDNIKDIECQISHIRSLILYRSLMNCYIFLYSLDYIFLYFQSVAFRFKRNYIMDQENRTPIAWALLHYWIVVERSLIKRASLLISISINRLSIPAVNHNSYNRSLYYRTIDLHQTSIHIGRNSMQFSYELPQISLRYQTISLSLFLEIVAFRFKEGLYQR